MGFPTTVAAFLLRASLGSGEIGEAEGALFIIGHTRVPDK